MYSSGYVPPKPPVERKRRSERNAAAGMPAATRETGMDMSSARMAPMNSASMAQGAPSGMQQAYPPYAGQGSSGARRQSYAPQQEGWIPPAAQPHQPQEAWGYSQSQYRGMQPQQEPWQGRNGYMPPPQPPTQQPSRSSGGGKPPKGPLFRVLMMLACVALVAALCVGGYYGMQEYSLRQYVAAYDQAYCQGVYVDGIHLGGMTQQQAYEAVSENARQRSDAWSVRLTYQGQLVVEITADQLGMTVDVTAPLQQAWSRGHTGSVHQRRDDMEALLQTPYEGYTALPGGDTSVVDYLLEEIGRKVYRAPQDAAITEFDPQKSNPFTFQSEVNGLRLNTAPIKERIYQMVSTLESGEIEIVPDTIAPDVTVAQLQQLVALRATATTDISSRSEEGRNNNIRRAFQLISGYVLQPGATFSFNSVVGERTLDNGFFEADEYAYNETVRGVGGGVCQASTTVYQAAVKAGMQIVKREPHSKEVGYCTYGMDATVYWSSNRRIDLSFKNTTEHPIYLVAAVQSDPANRKKLICKVSIYGESLGNVTYGMETRTVQVLDPPTEPERRKDTSHTYVTYKDEEKQVSSAKEGYVVESYRVTYVDGVETERMLLYTDTYKARAAVIYVGTKSRD